MIICPNCGSTNDENTKVCRKCGALLPVSTKPPRLRVPFGNREKEEDTDKKKKETQGSQQARTPRANNHAPAEVRFFNSDNSSSESNKNIELQEIPMSEQSYESEKKEKAEPETSQKARKEYLQEIDPSPFDGSMFASDPIERSSRTQPQPIPEGRTQQAQTQQPETQSSPSNQIQGRQKQLEKDMRDVLGFLSKKLQVPQSKQEVEEKKLTSEEIEIEEKELKPESLNEILKQLLNIDIQVEASALINRDGTILASAISDRISDTLFATIGQNLSMMGSDIIEGLSAGSLQSISVRGTEGVLDLAPIDPQNPNLSKMLLIIFSNPKVKSGVINIATNMVRKQVKEYLGIN